MASDGADPASGGMEQHGLASLQRVNLAQQILAGQALEHDRGRLLVADCVRQFDQVPSRQCVVLAIGTQRAGGIGDPVAGLQVLHALAHRVNHAGTLGAQAGRQARRLVEAAAEIGVDEVQADGVIAHPYLARSRRAERHIDLFQDFGTAVLAELDALGHVWLLVIERAPIEPAGAAFVNRPDVMLAGRPRFKHRSATRRWLRAVIRKVIS